MSNEYFQHTIDLADGQVKKLKGAKAVTIKHAQIGSGITIHLGGENHKRVMKAYKAKKNHRLKLTKDEIDQNEVSGSGFFKFIHKLGGSMKGFMKGVKEVAKIAAPIVKDVAAPAGAAIGTALATAIGNPELIPIAAPVGSALAMAGSKALTKYAEGKGLRVRKPRKPKVVLGEGVKLKSIGKVFKPIEQIAPQVTSEAVAPAKRTFRPVLGGKDTVYKKVGLGFVANRPTQIHHTAVMGGQLHNNHTFNNGYYNTLPLSNPAMHPFIESGMKYMGGRGFQASGY